MKNFLIAVFVLVSYVFVSNMDYHDQVLAQSYQWSE